MTDAKMITSDEIDRIFDEGEDMTPFVRSDSVRFPGKGDAVRKINGSIPEWVIVEMEREAKHLAVSRSAIMNIWLAEKAKDCQRERASA
ncbi:MAG: hypothetical protein LBH87_00335 [Coriobacteriales bacterium]|jgi:hypothetical protein|nr:hypothetical protein [Coriobacteriales bacterium]